jgi:uncharacterized iron-regulated membrane protein
MRFKFHRFIRKAHKWLGLVLGIQILFWIAGGVVMSVIPLEKVHGKHLATKTLPSQFSDSDYTFSLDSLIEKVQVESLGASDIKQVRYMQFAGQPAYSIETSLKRHMFHAQTGKKFIALTEEQVIELAYHHYLGEDELESVLLLETAPAEASRATGSVWQVRFYDTWSTTLYFSPTSAELVSIRSDIWRLFDFVWMLHIMDYNEREDFNNPLLITFSISALLFTMTGFLLLFRSFVRIKRPAV